MQDKRVILGMSGGVDSAVSAAVLMRSGYEVTGVTCLFTAFGSAHEAAGDAAAVCDLLGIRHVVRDCTSLFTDEVITPFVDAFESGLTPSPCMVCNASCKVPALIVAAQELACSSVATGHYARVVQMGRGSRFAIKTAFDTTKDQSYMLSQLSQDQIARLVLPLGAMTKKEVRMQAAELGFAVADKPESQDICFAQGGHVPFLEALGVQGEEGNIVTSRGAVVGRHQGLFRYTIGQRKGIGVAASEPYYVIGKRFDENELVVGFKEEALIDSVRVLHPNWLAVERPTGPVECTVKLRYRGTPAACTVTPCGDASVTVELASPQPATAPGQYAVFYEGELMLGGGMIAPRPALR